MVSDRNPIRHFWRSISGTDKSLRTERARGPSGVCRLLCTGSLQNSFSGSEWAPFEILRCAEMLFKSYVYNNRKCPLAPPSFAFATTTTIVWSRANCSICSRSFIEADGRWSHCGTGPVPAPPVVFPWNAGHGKLCGRCNYTVNVDAQVLQRVPFMTESS